MIKGFLFVWIMVTMLAFTWAWLMQHEDRKKVTFWIKRAIISAAIALVIIGAAFTLNNISGV